jgi:hypothetical protein
MTAVNSKTGEGRRCIYTQPPGLCDGSQPLHPKEHYLPAALGNFRNDVRLRDYICTRCQQNFSSLEDVFIHHGPEAFFRNMIGLSGRKKHRKKNIFYERTAGMPPLTVIAQQPGQDYTVLWQMDGMSEGRQMKQLVFRDEQNTDIHLPFVPGRLAKDFERFRKEHKGKPLRLITYVYDTANPAEEQEIELVCCDFLKGIRGEPMVPEGGNIEAGMRAGISLPYLRAVAKIGFHFVLAHFPFTGLEPQFDGIKRFIFTGDDHARFVQSLHEPFVEELKNPNAVLKRWCHLLSAQYDYDTVEARMQFFAGPKLQPLVWRVMLGSSPSRVAGTCSKGFNYHYFDAPDKEGYVGAMTPLQPAKP